MSVADVSTETFDRATQDTPLTARYSLDESQIILSFCEPDIPFDAIAKGFGPYTAEEMRTYISDNSIDWEATE